MRGEGGRAVSIRRGGKEIKRVVRLVFGGADLRTKSKHEKAVGFVNYGGKVRAVHAASDGFLFLDLEDASLKMLPFHRTKPERY